jgi:hypothetical protein
MYVSVCLRRVNLLDSSRGMFHHLKRGGIRTTRTVTRFQAVNHQSVYYDLEVSVRVYSNIGRARFRNPEFCRRVEHP